MGKVRAVSLESIPSLACKSGLDELEEYPGTEDICAE